MQMDNYYYALRLGNGTVIRVATQARSVYSVFLAASPFVMLILILIVSICIVLAHFLTKQLLHPIERLAENMEDTIEEPVYKELVPFVNTIRKQHENILMAAKVRQDFTANVSQIRSRRPALHWKSSRMRHGCFLLSMISSGFPSWTAVKIICCVLNR